MRIEWSTGSVRRVWVNGNVDDTGLWEGLGMWSSRCGITYVPAASLAEAQIVVVAPDEYSAVFGVTGFVGHSTTITDDATGLGRICYITAADDTGPNWTRVATWAHEAGHAEGEVDILGDADSIYSYGRHPDAPSQGDTERWQSWFGPSEAGTAFHAGAGSSTPGGRGVRGGGGDDTIWGDDGADLVYGNTGADSLLGGNDADTLFGGQHGDTLSGGAGDDVLYGNLAADMLVAGAGNDTLYGGQGDDVLVGGQGGNVLVGGFGADTIHAGHGDTVVGFVDGVDTLVIIGQGAPTFVPAGVLL